MYLQWDSVTINWLYQRRLSELSAFWPEHTKHKTKFSGKRVYL